MYNSTQKCYGINRNVMVLTESYGINRTVIVLTERSRYYQHTKMEFGKIMILMAARTINSTQKVEIAPRKLYKSTQKGDGINGNQNIM
ncbi:hypothetical protein SNE40_013598 [Patella caerulea]|uniref:Uncharacterized protein n=1 Tax=Patella caerulea TaxID=87958 RepID=A0AAN8JDS5_PATCE